MDYELAANCLRFLSIDMVEKAGSGHPGAAMGMADFFTVLYCDFLRFDPGNPRWDNRDRLILSNGHASTILYSAMFLAGYHDISLEQLKQYREFGAATTGHPEYQHFGGIEVTTGPLGQGIAMGVGMALAERLMHRDHPVIDHSTYVVLGDGCLMEGISYEAAAFAGRQKLSQLIVLFDDNGITIEGDTSLVTVEDHCEILKNMGWSTYSTIGDNHDSIRSAIAEAKKSQSPSFIAIKTKIGYGAPNKEGHAIAHGAPLGGAEMDATRENLEWDFPPFEIPGEGLELWRSFVERNAPELRNWKKVYSSLKKSESTELDRRKNGELPYEAAKALDQLKREFTDNPKTMSTRKVTPILVDRLTSILPELIGGSGDLGESNGSLGSTMKGIFPENDYSGNYIHYGVREHFMAACLNGFAAYGSFKIYGSTYFVFADYMRPAIRLASVMGVPSIYLFSHDSIGVGPDGPTHQAVEQLASLRIIPRLKVYRPADPVEAVECWELVLSEKNVPSALVMARQESPPIRLIHRKENLSSYGGYEISRIHDDQVLLVSSGTDVANCLEAASILKEVGVKTSVVSVPCLERLLEQDKDYINNILGSDRNVIKVAVESAVDFGWSRWLGTESYFIGMKDFGVTGPGDELYKYFGLDANGIVTRVMAIINELGDVNRPVDS